MSGKLESISLCLLVCLLLVLTACGRSETTLPDDPVNIDTLYSPHQQGAYAFADVGYQGRLNPLATFTSHGEVRSTYLGTGSYRIVLEDFTGLFSTARVPFYGNVQVTAKGSAAANCKLVDWKAVAADVTIEVTCRSLNRGRPLDSAFTLLAVQPSVEGPMGYAYVDSDEWHSTISAPRAYTSSGRDTVVIHASTGNYDVFFTSVNRDEPVNVQITAVGNSGKFCRLGGVHSSPTLGTTASVSCFDVDGRPADSAFSILALWPDSMPTRGGFTTTRNISSRQFYLTEAAVTHNPIRHDVFSRDYQTARYNVKFEGHRQLRDYAYSGGLGSVQVTPVYTGAGSDAPVHCQIENWRFSSNSDDLWASINCYSVGSNTYSRTPSAFSILALVPPADLSVPKEVQVQVMSLDYINDICSQHFYAVSFEGNDQGRPNQYVRSQMADSLRVAPNWSPTFTTTSGGSFHDITLTAFSLPFEARWCRRTHTATMDANPEPLNSNLKLRIDMNKREVSLRYRTASGLTYTRLLGREGDVVRLRGDMIGHDVNNKAEIVFKVNIQDVP